MYWLNSLGAMVKGYSLDPDPSQSLYKSIEGEKLCDSVIGDIRDFDLLNQAVKSFQPHYVFHFAAQPLVRLSYKAPVETFSVNAIGTAHVLQALHSVKSPCIAVMITTDKVYENQEWIYPYREHEPLGGYDPYSASKACAEIIISSFRNSFYNPAIVSKHGKAIASARAGNVIGGGDWALDRLVPDIVKALTAKADIVVRNPQAIRPWQHVLEPLSGYLTLACKMTESPDLFADSFNFGPRGEDHISVESFVKKAITAWGTGRYHTPPVSDQPHEANYLKLDINKATAKLQWNPVWTAGMAIERTLKWYKSFQSGTRAADLVKADLDLFISSMHESIDHR